MRYYLVDKYDEIVTKVDLGDDIGVSGAKTYFLGIKNIDKDYFDKLCKVMSEETYDLRFKASLQNRQMGNRKFEWWKDEPSGPDDGFDY